MDKHTTHPVLSLGYSPCPNDTLIADAGLPIPAETARIDLALTRGVPGAAQTLQVVLEELKVEKAIPAEEVKERNPQFLALVQEMLPGVPLEFIPHTDFKARTGSARAVVRTGEFSPYANVILVSGGGVLKWIIPSHNQALIRKP